MTRNDKQKLETMKGGLLIVGLDGNLIGKYIGEKDTESITRTSKTRIALELQKIEVLNLRSKARGVLEKYTGVATDMIEYTSMKKIMSDFLDGKLDFIVCRKEIAKKFPGFYKKYNSERHSFNPDHHCRVEYVVISAWRGSRKFGDNFRRIINEPQK